MATINIARTFDMRAKEGRDGGRVGLVNMTVESDRAIKFTINGKDVAPAGVDHLLTFALQTLQDAYAGADSVKDATERFETKLARILDGSVGVRTGGGRSETEKVRDAIVLAALVKKYGKERAEAEDIDAQVAAAYGKNMAAFDKLVAEEMARREAAKKAKAAIANGMGELDL